MNWAFLVVMAAAVVAAWDIGRRLTQKTAHAELSARIEALASQRGEDCQYVNSLRETVSERLGALSREVNACQGKVLELDTKLRGLTNKTEAAAAANRPRGGFPRIG